MIREALGRVARDVARFGCVDCGEVQEFTDLRRGDAVDHRCGWKGSGGTWWVRKASREGRT